MHIYFSFKFSKLLSDVWEICNWVQNAFSPPSHVMMDFVVGLFKSSAGYDAIWVVVDRLMKSACFIPHKTIGLMEMLAELYIKEIVKLHGVPV